LNIGEGTIFVDFENLASRKKELVIAKTEKLKKAVDAGVEVYKQ